MYLHIHKRPAMTSCVFVSQGLTEANVAVCAGAAVHPRVPNPGQGLGSWGQLCFLCESQVVPVISSKTQYCVEAG